MTQAQVIQSSSKIRDVFSDQHLTFGSSPLVKADRYALETCDLTDLQSFGARLKNMGVDFR